MNRDEIQRIINIPKNVSVDRIIPKNSLYQGLNNSKEKQIIQEDISKIIWLASFKSGNTNISPFKNENENYPEVELLFVNALTLKPITKIFGILSKMIPYPLIVVFRCEEEYQIFAAEYRVKKDDFLMINKIVKSPIIDKSHMINFFDFNWFDLQTINMKLFYKSFEDKLLSLSIERSKDLKENVDYKEVLELQKQIEILTNKAKKEDQLNLRVDLLKQVKIKINKLNEFYRG